jgi:hypothetical protein
MKKVRKLPKYKKSLERKIEHMLRIPETLYEQLKQTQSEKGIPTFSKTIINILAEYYDPKPGSSDVNLVEFKTLLADQREYFENLSQLMKSTLKEAPESEVKSLEKYQERILKLLKNPTKFEDICIVLQDMNEFQVFLLLSILYDKNKLIYNEKREYYAI